MAENRFGAISAEEEDEAPAPTRFGAISAEESEPAAAAQALLRSTFSTPEIEPVRPKRSFGEKAARQAFAVASGISDVVPFAPQIIARLRTLKGPETYEEELAKVREEKAMIEEGEPVTTGASRAFGTLASIPAIGAGAGLPGAALRFGAYGGAQAATQEGATAGDVAKSAAFGAAVPAMFKGASTLARTLAPTTTTGTLGALGLRTVQTAARAAPYVAVGEQPAKTLFLGEATPAEKTEAAINLLALPLAATQELRQGTRRSALRQAESIAERARPEAEELVQTQQETKAQGAIRSQRALEAETEAARSRAAGEAISDQRKVETGAYEKDVSQEIGRELQTARARSEEARLLRTTLEGEVVRQERGAQQDALEQQVAQVQEQVRLSKTQAEDHALTDAQQRKDIATENRIWEQKNSRAQRAVKEEQRITSSAERLRSGDQSAIAELQNDVARLKRAEDAIAAGDDPSLRGAVAKEYQDMRHRLETAIGFFQDGGVEPPPEYLQAYDSVRESYLRNTKAQGYTGFGTPDELFLEDPKAWAERKKQRMLQKTEVERTGKEADLAAFLDSIVARDYMAEARATRAGPQVPVERLREIFADQGLEYDGGPLASPDGVPLKQAFVGGRLPDAPFTSQETMAQSIRRRRQLQTDQEIAGGLMRNLRRMQPRVSSVAERQRATRLAELQAQQAAGFSGLNPRQEIEQAVRGRMPAPTGMPEADILSRAGVSPTAAPPLAEADIRQAANITPVEAARIFAERRAAAEQGLEYGTPSPGAKTLKRMDLDSSTRAVYEMMKPTWLRGGLRSSIPGIRLGGLAPGAEAPRYLGERVGEDPTQTRFGLPFQAFALADRFTKVLQRNASMRSRYDQFVRGAAKRGRGEDLKGFVQDIANFIANDPEAASEMKQQEASETQLP